MKIKDIIKNIFSVYNQSYYKIVCILGFKIKIFSLKKYIKFKEKTLKKYAKINKLPDKAFQSLHDRINNLETKGFRLLSLDKELILSNQKIKIATDRYAWIAQEIFYDELYNIPSSLINSREKYCVLDIGANRCYTALYFAEKQWIKRVDSFEIIPYTHKKAEKNIKLNTKYFQNKINLYNFGLSNQTTSIEALYLPNRDGISTINKEWIEDYAPNAAAKSKKVLCEVKQASIALRQIIEEQNLKNIIFKIDVEGAEYEILEDLADNYPEIFEEIVIMIGDTHCGFDRFLRTVSKFNFKIIEAQPEETGACSFLLVNNKYRGQNEYKI